MSEEFKKIAIVEKCPSKVNYEKTYQLNIDKVYQLSSTKVTRLLKKDVDLVGFDPFQYDMVILVGSEAAKQFTEITSVTDYTGKKVKGKEGYENYVLSISPAMLAFKPENRPVFDRTRDAIHKELLGETVGQKKGDYVPLVTTEACLAYMNKILLGSYKVIALDSECSSLDCRDGYMLGISMSHKAYQGVYMDIDCFDDECCVLLQKIVRKFPVVFHNAKFDMHFFSYHLGTDFTDCIVHDTMIMHYVLDERQGTHGLKSLALTRTDMGDYDKALDDFKIDYCSKHGLKREDFSYAFIPFDIMWPYAAKDTDATIRLFLEFYPIICKNDKLSNAYHNLLLPGLHFLTRMENRGIPLSAPRLTRAREILEDELLVLKEELYTHQAVLDLESVQGEAFNPNSTQQLRKLLFDFVGLRPTGKMTATGAISTDAEVLKELGELHAIPQLILDIRQKTKLKNTYIDKLLPAMHRDGRIRTGFNLTTTTSGRLSSSGKFNMQQLPRDNPIIKGCVKARPGYKIVACDLTTAEVYYAAVLSGDKALQQVFINMQRDPKKYPDFHSNIAHMVFHLDCDPCDVKKLYPALRQAAKAVTFGIMYGSGPSKVAEAVNEALLENGQPASCDKEEAEGYIATYFQRFPQLKKWIAASHAEIKQNGFIYNFFGRKRRLMNINSADRGIASGEVRSGFNAIIQSVSSDHLLLGAIDADLEIIEKGLDCSIFGLVHDSIVAEVREDLVPEYLEIVYRNIQKDRGCSIPGYPIGVDQDSEEGGSDDYGCGKLKKFEYVKDSGVHPYLELAYL